MVVFDAKLNSVDRVERDGEGRTARPRRRHSVFESLPPPAHCGAQARKQPVRIMEGAAAVSKDALRPGIERIHPRPRRASKADLHFETTLFEPQSA